MISEPSFAEARAEASSVQPPSQSRPPLLLIFVVRRGKSALLSADSLGEGAEKGALFEGGLERSPVIPLDSTLTGAMGEGRNRFVDGRWDLARSIVPGGGARHGLEQSRIVSTPWKRLPGWRKVEGSGVPLPRGDSLSERRGGFL